MTEYATIDVELFFKLNALTTDELKKIVLLDTTLTRQEKDCILNAIEKVEEVRGE